MEIYELTAHELSEKMEKKEISSEEIVRSIYNRINQVEKKLHSFVTLTEKEALLQARNIDEKMRKGGFRGLLAGIPVAIKDNMCIRNARTTCSSHILENFISPYEATVVKRLRDEGAVFIGKTNMDEFAMGSSTENSYFGVTRNPWDMDYIPGGSSGGSATAVASDETILAIGSDTGGSIRQPAACCGVVGLKPTYGRVSRYGLVAFASSLDQIGPFGKDVEDAALLLNVLSGYDENDSTSVNLDVPDFTKSLIENVKGIKIGVPKEYFVKGLDGEVERAVKQAIELLKSLGAKTFEISLPHTEYGVAVYYLIAPSEASANLARYDGVRYGYRSPETEDLLEEYEKTRGEGFGAEVKRRIMLGTYALSSGYYDAYYLKAQKVRTLIKKDFDEAFEKVDAIVTPTAPTPAFKIGEKVDDPLQMYLSDIFTISANLAGIPGISQPCGFSKKGLPIGLQLLAKPFHEEVLLRIAYTYEKNTEWHKRKPKL
ncbi:Asp-tRNA(Asn)/Glu-tRNA(Gln) amidotransferase subunit GatA [bacterium]|nr:Asp-tRNA(Asn)/Glu-tRNA(Gln) amidotransferase subunit GatA [bacterium]